MPAVVALFDVDGTLIDTNYYHALAWYRSFRQRNLTPPMWRIHRAIGMGGDQLVRAVAGERVEDEHGDELRAGWSAQYEPLLDEVQPFEDAARLLAEVKARGHRIILATSAPKDHLNRYLDLLDCGALIDDVTSADDAAHTKPAPDLLNVALGKGGPGTAVMIGDSTWDVLAAAKVDVPTLAVRTGGFSMEELRDAGARSVHDSLEDLRAALDATPLA